MPAATANRPDDIYDRETRGHTTEATSSGVSWPAIIAGAFAAAALSLILLALGSGIGLSSVSPWRNSGVSLTTFTVMTAVWLIIVQWLAFGLGGYLTGRLRTKWVGLHTHEVFFRDTAHGLLTWAVASVVSAGLLASAASSVLGGATQATATVASGAALGTSQGQGATQRAAASVDPTGYYVDRLFRSDHPSANASNQDVRAESRRILVSGITNDELPAADRDYLAQLVAARTGLAPADAEKRVDEVIAQKEAAEVKVRHAADEARKVGARASFFTFLSLLIGAFIASTAAAIGGSHRDEY